MSVYRPPNDPLAEHDPVERGTMSERLVVEGAERMLWGIAQHRLQKGLKPSHALRFQRNMGGQILPGLIFDDGEQDLGGADNEQED